MKLSSKNYQSGFLVDHECLGGVSCLEDTPGLQERFVAYVVDLMTGEALGMHRFSSLDAAIRSLESLGRDWSFQPLSPCGVPGEDGASGCGNCSSDGGCQKKCSR